MRIIAVIPAYNEAPRIQQAVQAVLPHVAAAVVVNDASHDETPILAKAERVYVISHPINRGQGAALQTGTDFALKFLRPDIIVHFDADGQMRAEDIPELIAPLLAEEVDVVFGSRFLGDASRVPAQRKIGLFIGRVTTLFLSGLWLTDAHNGFRALHRRAAEDIRFTFDRMAHASEIVDLVGRRGWRYVERPVTILYTDATYGKGQSFVGGARVVKDILKKRFLG